MLLFLFSSSSFSLSFLLSPRPWQIPRSSFFSPETSKTRDGTWLQSESAAAQPRGSVSAPPTMLRTALLLLALAEGCRALGTVALTREVGKNAALKSRLDALGISTVEAPCIATEELPACAEVPGLLRGGGFDYLIITSPEAASVLLRAGGAAAVGSTKVAAVGGATRKALEDGGVEVAFMPSKALGKALAAELPLDGGSRVLYAASRLAAATIPDGLGARGFEVARVDTYDTVPAVWDGELSARAAEADVVAFASPSAVRVWTERVAGCTGKLAACIGETSATCCRELGYERVEYPEKPGLDGWVDAIVRSLEVLESR